MDDKTKTELVESSQIDDELQQLDEFLEGLEPGITVVISRVEPTQFKGILEEIDITETSDPISLNYLINTWGGYKLRLRFRRRGGQAGGGQWVKHRDIAFYSYPPLIRGRALKQAAQYNPALFGDEQRFQYQQKEKEPENPLKAFIEMASMMQTMRQSELQTLASLMRQPEAPPVPIVPSVEPIQQLGQLMQLMSQFQSFQNPVSATVPQEGDQVIGMITKMADVLTRNNPEPPIKLIGPVQNPSTQPPAKRLLFEDLSKLEPIETVNTLKAAFASMPPQKAAETMQALLGSIEEVGGVEILLNGLEQRGIIGSDDTNAVEINPGGQSSPDESND